MVRPPLLWHEGTQGGQHHRSELHQLDLACTAFKPLATYLLGAVSFGLAASVECYGRQVFRRGKVLRGREGAVLCKIKIYIIIIHTRVI